MHAHQMWSRPPNCVILSLARFAQRADVRGFVLNRHWYKIFKTCLSRCPNIIRFINFCEVDVQLLKSTEWLVAYVETRDLSLNHQCQLLRRFTSIRHVTIEFNGTHHTVNLLKTLNDVLHSLSTLESIKVKFFHRFITGLYDDFIQNLPRKVTTLQVSNASYIPLFETHFPQLVYFAAPYWCGGIEPFCCKMVNLHTLLFFGMPKSFECFRLMSRLQTLKWYLRSLSLEDWNQFAVAVALSNSTLRVLEIRTLMFSSILFLSEAVRLLTVREFSFVSDHWALVHLDHFKRLMPQLKHVTVDVGFVQDQNEFEELFIDRLPQQANALGLDFVTVDYNIYAGYGRRRITYHRGDSSVYKFEYLV